MSLLPLLRCDECGDTFRDQHVGSCGVVRVGFLRVCRKYQELVDRCTLHFCSKSCLVAFFTKILEKSFDEATPDAPSTPTLETP